MKTRIVSLALIAVSLLAALAAACLLGGCGGNATAGEAATISTSPAPAWLAEEAAAQAERLGDPEPDAAYWRYDPSHSTYTIVLVGEFETAHLIRGGGRIDPTDGPGLSVAPEPSRWVLMTYSKTHEPNGFGCGPHAFDFSAYPDLQPLAL